MRAWSETTLGLRPSPEVERNHGGFRSLSDVASYDFGRLDAAWARGALSRRISLLQRMNCDCRRIAVLSANDELIGLRSLPFVLAALLSFACVSLAQTSGSRTSASGAAAP